MYQVKIYNRSDASLVSKSKIFSSISQARVIFDNSGFGEGYWVELHRVYPNYSVSIVSTV